MDIRRRRIRPPSAWACRSCARSSRSAGPSSSAWSSHRRQVCRTAEAVLRGLGHGARQLDRSGDERLHNALNTASCADIIYRNVSPCQFKGSRTNGMACGASEQCMSGHCAQSDTGCGVCAGNVADGAMCTEDEDCAAGRICNDENRCVLPAAAGTACNDNQPCAYGADRANMLLPGRSGDGRPCTDGAGCSILHSATAAARTFAQPSPSARRGRRAGSAPPPIQLCSAGLCFSPTGVDQRRLRPLTATTATLVAPQRPTATARRPPCASPAAASCPTAPPATRHDRADEGGTCQWVLRRSASLWAAMQRVFQQHGDGHRTDAARDRRDGRGALEGAGEVNVAAPACRRRPRFMPTSMTTAPGFIHSPRNRGLADGGDQRRRRRRHLAGQIPGLRVADGDGGAGVGQEQRHRPAHDVGAAHHHRARAGAARRRTRPGAACTP